jgi:signal transduction histidine kinase
MEVNVRPLEKFWASTTTRLAASYLAIIMLMSVGFSIVFYNASWHELGRQVPPPDSSYGIRRYVEDPTSPIGNFLEERIDEGRHHLLIRLILLNLLALAGGSLISYYLARRTLEPIETNMESQSQFVSDASHELRTPLTVLQTTNEVALRKKKLTLPEARDVLGQNVAEVVKLQDLTDKLLRLAKLDNSTMSLAPVPLGDIVTDAVNVIVPAAKDKKIKLEDSVPKLSVLADRPGLAQALVTILDNAVKYGPDKSTVYIKAVRQGKQAVLTIRDEGDGIKAEHLPHVFDRFYRADEARSKHEADGFGIGLALAKKIIEQHNGEIGVESVEGQGAIFIIRLPLS